MKFGAEMHGVIKCVVLLCLKLDTGLALHTRSPSIDITFVKHHSITTFSLRVSYYDAYEKDIRKTGQ